jgi:hypothetical protein
MFILWGLKWHQTVLKNAFYELEMPIRVEQFDQKLAALMQQQQQQSASR